MKHPMNLCRSANACLVVAACCAIAVPLLQAQPGPEAAERVTTRIGSNRVSITITGGERMIEANGWPDHAPGQFPRSGNPNRLAEQRYQLRIPLEPRLSEKPTHFRHALFGVALNGVPFDPGTAEFWNNDPHSGWVFEAKSGFINLGLDEHNAHVQPGGAYHYHGMPLGLIKNLGGDGRKMLLIGYAADGFPVYTSYGLTNPRDTNSPLKKLRSSYRLRSGSRPGPGGPYDGRFTEDYEYVKGTGDLDECNGRFGVTPEYPIGTYHYHLTDQFPYIPRLWRGIPDASFQKKGGPPRPRGSRPGGPRSFATASDRSVSIPVTMVRPYSALHLPNPK